MEGENIWQKPDDFAVQTVTHVTVSVPHVAQCGAICLPC